MKCFYHNDIDGRCAGALVAHYEDNNNPEDFFEVDYVHPLPIDRIAQNEVVYLVDYSFKEASLWQLQAILERTEHVVWIDHHSSSLELIKAHPELRKIAGIRLDKISGAGLTWVFCNIMSGNTDGEYRKAFYNQAPMFVKYVSDYDCWIYEYPNTEHFKLGIETFNYDALDTIWQDLINQDMFNQNLIDRIVDKGRDIREYIKLNDQFYFDHYAYKSEIAGLPCWVVNRKSNSWVFGEHIKEVPIVVVWVFDGNLYNYSIFSTNPEVNCSKIAESLGGGGHKGAAGFSSTELLFKKV